jgi:histidinol-phosphate/aromatic aminotransferase/cobyric acid decarboxylase-like protein
MAPLRFALSRIQALLELAGRTLDGEWLLIGGAAAAAWFAPARTTEDLDIIGLQGTQEERFALMTFAEGAAIPIEAVNSAADFFVRRIAGWRDELIVLLRGPRATIYRPSATLFLLLKINRLSATDLEDCLGLLAHCALSHEALDRARARGALAALAETDDVALRARRQQLARALD